MSYLNSPPQCGLGAVVLMRTVAKQQIPDAHEVRVRQVFGKDVCALLLRANVLKFHLAV